MCANKAVQGTDGWVVGGLVHGCPDHPGVVDHAAILSSHTQGRGYKEKTTWYLTCKCGWTPSPSFATHNYTILKDQHRWHVNQEVKA
jgi:hypothetical protein